MKHSTVVSLIGEVLKECKGKEANWKALLHIKAMDVSTL